MKTTRKGMVAAGILLFGLTAPAGSALAADAPDKPEVELSMGLYSQYISRGMELSREAVLQPSLNVEYKGFGLNLWGNLDTDPDLQNGSEWNETDMTLFYAGACGKISYEAGLIYYAMDSAIAEDTQEIYGILSYDILLQPTLSLYRDIANAPGWYATFGISHSLPLTEKMNLDLGASVGYQDFPADDYHEFHDGLLTASLSYALNDMISITPELNYSFALSSTAKDFIAAASFDGEDHNFIYGGISASFTF